MTDVVDTAGSTAGSSDSEHAYPHRVFVWVLFVLPIVWGGLMLVIVLLYKFLLRGPKKKKYELAQNAGRIFAGTGDDGEGQTKETANSWVGASIKKIQTENGLDAALYLLHNQHMALFCLVQFAAIGIPLCLVYSQGGDYEHGLSMYAWSYANLAPDNMLRFVPVVMSYIIIGTTVGLLMYKQSVMDKYKVESVDTDAGTSTVWVTGIPADATEEQLREYLTSTYGDKCVDSRLVWDVNKLGHNIRARRRLITKTNELHAKSMAEDASAEDVIKIKAKIAVHAATIKALEAEEPEMRKKKLTCAGSAFVTFKTKQICKDFRLEVSTKQLTAGKVDLGCRSWSTAMAPKPFEIYWENFGLDSGQKMTNNFKSFWVTAAMFVFFIIIALCCVWLIGYKYMELLYYCKPVDAIQDALYPMIEGVTPYVWYGLFVPLFLGFFLFLEEEMAPIVKFISKYELPLTKSHKQASFLGKCYFFYVIYHLLLSTALLGLLAATVKVASDMQGGPVKLYVESIGMFHQNRCFLTACIIDMAHVLEGTSFFTRPGHTLTKEEESKFAGAEEEEDDEEKIADAADEFFNDKFNYSRNYGETIGVFTSICYYQVMHPTILLCGSFYYMAKFYVDKYQITNQYTRPHLQYGRRARSTTTYILTAMTIGQLGNVIFFIFLVDDMLDVGLAMFGSLFLSFVVTMIYIVQPQIFKTAKTQKVQRTSSKDVELSGEDSLDLESIKVVKDRVAKRKSGDGGYHPPHPDDLKVGVTIDDGAEPGSPGGGVKYGNPMGHSQDAVDE